MDEMTLYLIDGSTYKYKLIPHVGNDRFKDAKLLMIAAKARAFDNEGDLIEYFATHDQFDTIAIQALDLDDTGHEGIAEKVTFIELFRAFMDALAFRTQDYSSPETQEAVKKSKGGAAVKQNPL